MTFILIWEDIIKRNGADKTTVFKILIGLLIPRTGKSEVLGRDISINKEQVLRDIGSLIEVPTFYEHLSATENLEMHLAYMGVNGVDIFKTLGMVVFKNIDIGPVWKS